MSKTLLDIAREKRAEVMAPADQLIAAAEAESRDLTADEFGKIKEVKAAAAELDERIAELSDLAKRNNAAAEIIPAPKGGAIVREEPRTYSQASEREGVSFLRDMVLARMEGDPEAQQRLARHKQEERVTRADALATIERRDVGTGAFTGLTVPQYLTDLVAPVTRALRPFADICARKPLPASGMTVNISRITTGSANAVQASENAGVQETDMDDTLLTVDVRTIAGQQDVSRQAIERGTGIEGQVIADLVAAYQTELDRGILNDSGGSGTHVGVRQTSGNVAVTYTDASPTAAELYPKLADLIQQVQAATNMGVTHFVMHPRRWWWLAAQLSSTFPLLTVPSAGTQQAGQVGDTSYAATNASLLGVPVVLDRNVPVNLGAGTNEDIIFGVDASECHLWEDANAPLLIRTEPAAGNLQVKFVVYGYSAFTAGRYPLATGDITGTGLITPTF
jgi:HK97 family phage major capsid protein